MKEVRAEEGGLKQCDIGGSNEMVGDETGKQGGSGVVKSGKRIVSLGRKGGTLTPASTWKMEWNDENGGDSLYCSDSVKGITVSSRKLAANLWELQNVFWQTPPLDSARKMKKSVVKTGDRREKNICISPRLLDSSRNLIIDHRPTSTQGLRRQMAASLIEEHTTVDGAMLPESSASFCSSLEIAAYDQATPCSSLDIKGRHPKLSSNHKTSTELLNVLNRIWILEEKHASSVSKIKTLKLERDHAQARLEDLILEQQEERKRIDELMKQFTEEKLITKSGVRDRIKSSVQSLKVELDDERKLRRKSEGLHRKLAEYLTEVKMTLSKTVKELARERNTRLLMEDFCDELAKGVADYEQEVHELKRKYEKDSSEREDRFIVHIAEAWLDERVQVKLAEEDHDSQDNSSRLQCEIGTLLRIKQSSDSRVHMLHAHRLGKDDWIHRCSMESVPLNEAASGRQFAGRYDSIASESDRFNINRSVEDAGEVAEKDIYGRKVIADLKALMKPNAPRLKVLSQEGRGRSSCSSMGQLGDKVSCSESGRGEFFSDRIVSTHAKNINEDGADSSNQIEVSVRHRSDNCDIRDDGCQSVRQKQMQRTHHVNQFTLLPKGSVYRSENKHKEEDDYTWKARSVIARDRFSGGAHEIARSMKPRRVWGGRPPDLDLRESSSEKRDNSKENSLKAKLLEARLEGQQARLRLARCT